MRQRIMHLIRVGSIATVLLAMMLSGRVAATTEVTDACLQEAAQTGFGTFMAHIPSESLPEYGFATAVEAAQARLGTPNRLSVILPQTLLAYVPGSAIAGLISDTAYWYFPILVSGTARAFLVVEGDGTSCRAVSLGLARLASQLSVTSKDGVLASGKQLVIVYQANEYLIADVEPAYGSLRSLQPEGTRPAREETADDTIRRLKKAVERSLSAGAGQ